MIIYVVYLFIYSLYCDITKVVIKKRKKTVLHRNVGKILNMYFIHVDMLYFLLCSFGMHVILQINFIFPDIMLGFNNSWCMKYLSSTRKFNKNSKHNCEWGRKLYESRNTKRKSLSQWSEHSYVKWKPNT